MYRATCHQSGAWIFDMIPKFLENGWTRALGCSSSSWATLKMEAVRIIESSERNISIMSQKRAILSIILTLFLSLFLFGSIYLCSSYVLDQDSSVGTATRYGLGSPGIEFRCGGGGGGRDFLHPSRLVLGPTHSPIKWVTSLSLGVK